MTAVTAAPVTNRFFAATVTAVTDLTPSFRRFTFSGPDLDEYGDPGFDQRVKVVFPSAAAGLETMPLGEDWYLRWRELDEHARPTFRTYTTRRVRRQLREVDIDMVAHDVRGPASAWIAEAKVGDEVLIFAPTIAHTGVSYGIDFVPPAHVDQLLLAGDETAAPAIAVILEQLPRTATGVVVVELPHEQDLAYLPMHPGFTYRLHARADRERHTHLIPAVEDITDAVVPAGGAGTVEEVDIDAGILWEVPRTAKGGAALKRAPLYAWLAGESGAIKALRRHLVAEHGVDRRAVAFMGYWRDGRAEN